MRKVRIDNLIPGSILAKSVFTGDGRNLLTSGLEIREGYMEKLKISGIREVYIEDDLSDGLEIPDIICENTRLEAKILTRKLMDSCNLSGTFSTAGVIRILERIIDELLSSRDILVNLCDIKSVDDYTFEHSVNVCTLSLMIGIGLEMDRYSLRDLGLGALLHDIGKLRVPESILKKPARLSVEEFEEVKKHTGYGYEILSRNESICRNSVLIAYEHHERCDGSGYPAQAKASDIHPYAQIVAVADVYDALSSDRVYREKLRPYEVVEYISSLSSIHFDRDIVDCFTCNIAIYPIGSGVVLNTGERAIVMRVNRDYPTKPTVRVVFDPENRQALDHRLIDLRRKKNMFIVDTCEL